MGNSYLTVEQFAELMQLDKFTVYRLISAKKIPAFKVGRQWRISAESIRQLEAEAA